MKFKGLLLNLGLIFFTTAAHANIVVFDAFSGKADVCQKVKGGWKGKGTLSIGDGFKCFFLGNGEIDSNESGKMSINNLVFNLDPNGSNRYCPKEPQKIKALTGECRNGKLTITTDAELVGDFDQEGNHLDLKGKVVIEIPPFGKIKPDVDIKLDRA